MRELTGGLWAAFTAAGLAAAWAGVALGHDGEQSVLLATVAAGALLLGLERLRPERPDWRTWAADSWQDIGHLFAGFGLGVYGGTALARWLVPRPLLAVWPAGWPQALQVVLGLVVMEFFLYWQHRAVHRYPALWHLHALHHNPTRMTFLKTTRIHAFDIGTATLLSVAPLLAVGAPAGVLLWVTAFGNFLAQAQHANVRLRTPAWLNRVIGTPATHWLHHSLDQREGNSNFGMNLMIWDHLFGTYIAPPAAPAGVLGIEPDDVPRTFLGQLALPWRTVRTLLRGK